MMMRILYALEDSLSCSRFKNAMDALANLMKKVEEAANPDAVLLEGLPRMIQVDTFSCGAQSALVVLKYYGRKGSIKTVRKELGTTRDGTDWSQLRKLFLKRKLKPISLKKPTVKMLKQEIKKGNPVIVSMDEKFDRGHWAVVYGYGPRCIFVADPSMKRALLCRHSTRAFLDRWDKWGMAVRP